MEELRLGRVQIFGLGVLFHGAATKGNDLAGRVFDREDHPAPEPIIRVAASIRLDNQASIQHVFLAGPRFREMLLKRAPAVRRKAKPVFGPAGGFKATAFQIASRCCAARASELFFEELCRRLADVEKPPPSGPLCPVLRRVIRELHARFPGEFFNRLGKREPLGFLQEGDDIAELARGEVLEELFLIVDVKARCFLRREGRKAGPFLAFFDEFHLAADHI